MLSFDWRGPWFKQAYYESLKHIFLFSSSRNKIKTAFNFLIYIGTQFPPLTLKKKKEIAEEQRDGA